MAYGLYFIYTSATPGVDVSDFVTFNILGLIFIVAGAIGLIVHLASVRRYRQRQQRAIMQGRKSGSFRLGLGSFPDTARIVIDENMVVPRKTALKDRKYLAKRARRKEKITARALRSASDVFTRSIK